MDLNNQEIDEKRLLLLENSLTTRIKGGMYYDGKFTKQAQEALQASQQVAAQLGHGYVGTEHILLGLIRVEESVAAKALKNQGYLKKILLITKAVIGSGDISIAEPQILLLELKDFGNEL